jgi:dihydropyrimidinase
MDGAMFCCSPPPRDANDQEAMWRGLANGTFSVFSSDHAPYRYDDTGKLAEGPEPTFKQIANGVPGIELRLPLLFSEGVGKGRIDLNRFVALTATNVAKLYGLSPQKGTIAVGSDADIVIFDPDREETISLHNAHTHHMNVDYNAYEGTKVRGFTACIITTKNDCPNSDTHKKICHG